MHIVTHCTIIENVNSSHLCPKNNKNIDINIASQSISSHSIWYQQSGSQFSSVADQCEHGLWQEAFTRKLGLHEMRWTPGFVKHAVFWSSYDSPIVETQVFPTWLKRNEEMTTNGLKGKPGVPTGRSMYGKVWWQAQQNFWQFPTWMPKHQWNLNGSTFERTFQDDCPVILMFHVQKFQGCDQWKLDTLDRRIRKLVVVG